MAWRGQVLRGSRPSWALSSGAHAQIHYKYQSIEIHLDLKTILKLTDTSNCIYTHIYTYMSIYIYIYMFMDFDLVFMRLYIYILTYMCIYQI